MGLLGPLKHHHSPAHSRCHLTVPRSSLVYSVHKVETGQAAVILKMGSTLSFCAGVDTWHVETRHRSRLSTCQSIIGTTSINLAVC